MAGLVKNILIVGQEPKMVHTLRRVLAPHGFKCCIADNADEARFLLDHFNELEVILADEQMPSGSASELLLFVKENFPSIGRVLMSGHRDIQLVASLLNKNVIDRCFTKPWELNSLIADIESLVEVKRLEKRQAKEIRSLKTAVAKLRHYDELTTFAKYPLFCRSLIKNFCLLNRRQSKIVLCSLKITNTDEMQSHIGVSRTSSLLRGVAQYVSDLGPREALWGYLHDDHWIVAMRMECDSNKVDVVRETSFIGSMIRGLISGYNDSIGEHEIAVKAAVGIAIEDANNIRAQLCIDELLYHAEQAACSAIAKNMPFTTRMATPA